MTNLVAWIMVLAACVPALPRSASAAQRPRGHDPVTQRPVESAAESRAELDSLTAEAPQPVSRARARQAESRYRRALQLLDRDDYDTRRMAIRELEQATLLDPWKPDYQLALARTYYHAGFLKSARQRFERLARLSPDDADARFGLGQVWRRDWLKYLDPRSLDRATESFSLAARLDPGAVDAWLMLVPLLVEKDDLRSAHAAAEHALHAAPERPEALLACAYTAYRLGDVDAADREFASAHPRLARSVRERLDDIAPVATARDTFILRRLPPAEQVEFVRRFWKDLDPDLATIENEARLEYWSRVAHAYFLFFDPKRREWDERGEVYVRYGRPKRATYNPVGISLHDWAGTPRNVLVWEYPQLGMRVLMEDRLLSEYYLLPITRTFDPDPVPNPDSLAGLDDMLATRGGRGVFPKLPPHVEPLPVEGIVARFVGARGGRLLAQVETPGGPSDSLWAEWVVLDSTRREVQRAGRSLSPSACDATRLRVADFAAELPPGQYLVGLSVRDRFGRRGVYRAGVELPATRPSLELSDLVVCCGSPELGAGPNLRLEPNPAARVDGADPLTAYFEIYHLQPGADGQSRFEYVYTVSSAEKDSRIWLKRLLAPRHDPPPLEASRQSENPGSMRRQFVTVPLATLPAGTYRFEVRVRDLVANAEVTGSTEFVKLGPEGVRN